MSNSNFNSTTKTFGDRIAVSCLGGFEYSIKRIINHHENNEGF